MFLKRSWVLAQSLLGNFLFFCAAVVNVCTLNFPRLKVESMPTEVWLIKHLSISVSCLSHRRHWFRICLNGSYKRVSEELFGFTFFSIIEILFGQKCQHQKNRLLIVTIHILY